MCIRDSAYITEDNVSSGEPEWHYSREKITRVVIQDGVTSVGAKSFKNYTNLKTVEMCIRDRSSIETMVLSLDCQLERVTPSMVGSVWVEPYSMEIASDFSSIHLA